MTQREVTQFRKNDLPRDLTERLFSWEVVLKLSLEGLSMRNHAKRESSSRGESMCKGPGVEGSETGPRKLVWLDCWAQRERWYETRQERWAGAYLVGSCRCAQDFSFYPGASKAALVVESCLLIQETQARSLGQEDPLEEEMATHSSNVSWRIPWTEEPGIYPGCIKCIFFFFKMHFQPMMILLRHNPNVSWGRPVCL